MTLAAPVLLATAALLSVASAQETPAPPKDALYAPNNRGLLIWDAAGARTIASGDVAGHVAVTPDGKRVFVGTERSVLVVDPTGTGRAAGTGSITSELHLAGGMPRTEALVQALAVSGDGKRLFVAYRFRTMERMGYILGDPVVSAFSLDARGEPNERPQWTRLVPQQRDVATIFPGKSATDPVVLYHDLPVAFTRLDARVEGEGAFKVTVLDPKSPLKRPDRVLQLRPKAQKDGRILLPLEDKDSWVLCRFDASKGEILEVMRHKGPGSQAVAVSKDEKLVFVGFDRLRVHDLETGEQKLSIALTSVVHDLAVSSDGSELYANCGQRLLVLDAAKNFQVKSETALETVSRELAVSAAKR